ADMIVLDQLEAVRLNVAGIEELRSTDALGKARHRVNGSRLRQHRAHPHIIHDRRGTGAAPLPFRPFRLLFRATRQPAVDGGFLPLLNAWQQLPDYGTNVAMKRQRVRVVTDIIHVAIDVDDGFGIGIADARAIRLADAARADEDHQFRFAHGEVAADRAL